jgi:hypothetical protein
MRVRRRLPRVTFEARQVERALVVGRVPLEPGDWLIINDAGQEFGCHRDVFESCYEIVDVPVEDTIGGMTPQQAEEALNALCRGFHSDLADVSCRLDHEGQCGTGPPPDSMPLCHRLYRRWRQVAPEVNR